MEVGGVICPRQDLNTQSLDPTPSTAAPLSCCCLDPPTSPLPVPASLLPALAHSGLRMLPFARAASKSSGCRRAGSFWLSWTKVSPDVSFCDYVTFTLGRGRRQITCS